MELQRTMVRGYFSPYHFARDYLYSAAAVLLATVVAVLPSPEYSSLAGHLLASQKTTTLLVSAFLFFIASHGLGFVANSIVVTVVKGVTRVRHKTARSLFDLHYLDSKTLIDALYAKNFGDLVPDHGSMELGEKARQLIEFCRQHEGAGYVHMARNYALVYFHRQVLVYCLFLACLFGFQHRSWVAIPLIGIALFEVYNQARLVRESVAEELNYICSTCARLHRQADATAPAGPA